jgi:hypothetical protein
MNKRNLLFTIFAGLVLLVISSCDKDEHMDKLLTPPDYVKFNTPGVSSTYTITNSASSVFKLPVGFSTVSTSDRTVKFLITTSSATKGVQYNAPETITIPAGKVVDTLFINGLYAGYTASRRDTLKIQFAAPDTAAFRNTYTLIMRI